MNKEKLVRDFYPEIIIKKWKIPVFHIADDDEYYKRLKDKIEEELKEVFNAKKNEIAEELGDLKEVIISIAKFKGLIIEKLDHNDNNLDWETFVIKEKIKMILDFIKRACIIEWISEEEVESARINKLKKKWWFEKRIILEKY